MSEEAKEVSSWRAKNKTSALSLIAVKSLGLTHCKEIQIVKNLDQEVT